MSSDLERWFAVEPRGPFRELAEVKDSFERIFDKMLNVKKRGDRQGFYFSPSCEVAESNGSYVLKFDLPGVMKDQVRVEINEGQLTVHAERREEKEKEKEEKKRYLSEISYGTYTRSFTLPGAVDEKKVDAKFADGVLTVTVPKTEPLKTKQIPVQ